MRVPAKLATLHTQIATDLDRLLITLSTAMDAQDYESAAVIKSQYNKLQSQLKKSHKTIARSLQRLWDKKSDEWQQSWKGEQAQQMVDAWRENLESIPPEMEYATTPEELAHWSWAIESDAMTAVVELLHDYDSNNY